MTTVLNEKIIAESDIDSAELAQRVAVLKRFKTLLTQQRDRFRTYLNLLDKQQNVIESGSADDLLSFVEIEEKIVSDIFSIQKVIDPLEEMYNSLMPARADSFNDDVPDIKASLENLKSEAVIRSAKNKELLSKRMVELRTEIKSLRNNPYSTGRTAYSESNKASLIDIQG